MLPKGFGDERAAFRRELDQANAPVPGILPFTSAFFSSRSTATLIDPGVGHTFGSIVLTGNGPWWSRTSSTPEVRVAEACPAQVQALLRVRRQGAKRLREDQPDMYPRSSLRFSASLPHLNASYY